MPDITTRQVCPETLSDGADEVTNAYPDGWYIRIMFDELLDPSVEALEEILDDDGNGTGTFTGSIADANPVTLRCESVNGGMVTVDYDGYYSPSGNRITWPLGPSLVIKPNDPTLIATNSKCEVTINDSVKDKAGNAVETAQRGPYTFAVAPIQVLEITPADGDSIDAFTPSVTGISILFNTEVAPASVCNEGTGGNECEFTITPDLGTLSRSTTDGLHYAIKSASVAEVETDYTFSFVQGGKIADRCGRETTFGAPSEDDGTLVHFTTNPFDLNGATIASGETASPMKKLTLNFSNVVDLATLDTTEYSITPAPMSPTTSLGGTAPQTVRFNGLFNINTEYTFTLNAGATVADVHGAVFTNEEALTIKWKTQPQITATFAPADNGTVTKTTTTPAVGVSIAFNSAMLANDLTEGTEYTVTGPGGAAVTGFAVAAAAGTCGATSTSCTVTVTKDIPPGAYIFTLKAGATMADALGNMYTQAADKVIHFTVENAAPATPGPSCL